MICVYCGDEFQTLRLTARYCPDKSCKDDAKKNRNFSPSVERNKKAGGRVCAECGKNIDHKYYKARYCDGACKQASYRKRKKRKR